MNSQAGAWELEKVKRLEDVYRKDRIYWFICPCFYNY